MKRFFLDTNFLVDYLLRDEYKIICQQFLEYGIKRKAKFYISFLSVANFAYIARKAPKDVLYRNLHGIIELFNIIPNKDTQIIKVIQLNPGDFENGLQYQSALEADCECIITRNAKDFTFSELPVMSAEEYLAKYV